MHSCGCVIGRLCVDASDLVYIAHFVCFVRYILYIICVWRKPYILGPVQSSEWRELRSCLFRLVATVQTACVVVPCVMV